MRAGGRLKALKRRTTGARASRKPNRSGLSTRSSRPNCHSACLQPAVPVPPSEPEIGLIETPPLSPQASEKTIYLRDNPAVAPGQAEQRAYEAAGSEANRAYLAPGYLPLVTPADDTANNRFGGALNFLGATPDLSHVVFESKVGLTSAAPSAAGLYEWEAAGGLQLISLLPDGTPAADPFLGDGEAQGAEGGVNARHAISNDGSRVFWTDGKEHLYLRDTETAETIQINAAQGHGVTEPGPGGREVPEPGEGRQEVHFQTASADGSKVFFTDTARLTEDSTLEPLGEEGPADLYEFEVTSSPGAPLRGRLFDLTPVARQGSADVLNLIPGASEDGSFVYFVANGELAPGASPGHCARYYTKNPRRRARPAICISPSPIQNTPASARRGSSPPSPHEDAADWGADPSSSLIPVQDLSTLSSRVSPDGRYLAFMSDQRLTGYDNEDVSSEHPGERLDEEVFLYDASADRLICASCNPGGQRPTGVYDNLNSGEGLSLLVDRTENWNEHWLAGSLPAWTLDYGKETSATYQSRYLSNSGRLFFNSADALVPQVTVSSRKEEVNGAQQNVGVENVYEYEPEGVGSCQSSGGCVGLISSGTSGQESAFLDASETGNDVFFLTAAPLVSEDNDKAFDIYDARVCSEASPCLSSPGGSAGSCESSASCRPPTPSQPQAAVAPASASSSGPGNVAGTRVLASKGAVQAQTADARAEARPCPEDVPAGSKQDTGAPSAKPRRGAYTARDP